MIGDTVRRGSGVRAQRGYSFTPVRRTLNRLSAQIQGDLQLLKSCLVTMPRIDICRSRLVAGAHSYWEPVAVVQVYCDGA